jgi:hypothetical protein
MKKKKKKKKKKNFHARRYAISHSVCLDAVRSAFRRVGIGRFQLEGKGIRVLAERFMGAGLAERGELMRIPNCVRKALGMAHPTSPRRG